MDVIVITILFVVVCLIGLLVYQHFHEEDTESVHDEIDDEDEIVDDEGDDEGEGEDEDTEGEDENENQIVDQDEGEGEDENDDLYDTDYPIDDGSAVNDEGTDLGQGNADIQPESEDDGCVQDVVLLPRRDCIVDPRDPNDLWYGYVSTEVEDQGECGACQSFAAAKLIEDCYNLKHKTNIRLSPQLLMDAAEPHLDSKCKGNTPENIFYAAKNHGVGIMDTCATNTTFELHLLLHYITLDYNGYDDLGLNSVQMDVSNYRAAGWHTQQPQCPSVGCVNEDPMTWLQWGCKKIQITEWDRTEKNLLQTDIVRYREEGWDNHITYDYINYEEEALELLQTNGPIYCSIILTDEFEKQQNYEQDNFIMDDSDRTQSYEGYGVQTLPEIYDQFFYARHALSIIGYGTDENYVPKGKTNPEPERWDYWIIRNSWGKDIHKDGIFRMRRNVNAFGITHAPFYYVNI